MKKRLMVSGKVIVSALLLLALCGGASAADTLTQIAENVYAYVDTKNGSKDNSFGANAGIVIGEDGIVVVDTLISAREAKRFIRDIRAITNKPIRYVVNTHHHLDHSFGNCEFVRLGAVVIAQENDRKAMEKSAAETLKNIGNYGMTPEDMEGTTPAYPVLSYGDRMAIDIGGQRIELIHARHCHTGGDTLVWLPDRKILFTGDVLFAGAVGRADLFGGDMATLLRSIREKLLPLGDDVRVLPGHGPETTLGRERRRNPFLTGHERF